MRSLFGVALAASVCVTLVVAGCGGSNTSSLGGSQTCATGPCPQGDGGNPTPESGGTGLTCGTPTACGPSGSGRTYAECTQVASNGQCSAIVYEVSDGHAFTCAGCTNCGPVQQQLASYCATVPSGDAGSSSGGDASSGGDSSTGDASTDADASADADAGGDASGGGTTCLPAVACGSGGLTYEECTTTGRGGVCSSIQYEVSNGTSFTCASCSDCNTAIQQLDAYCNAQNPTTTCTASSPCETSPLTYQTCTTSIGGVCKSVYYETSDSQQFQCASCSSCTAAQSALDSYCTQHTPPVTTCGAANTCGAGGATYQLCTTSQGATCDSQQYTTSTGQTFSCSACGNCAAALTSVETYCASLTGTGHAVLFGGFVQATGAGLADTWLWNGSSWTAGPATGPAARADSDGATLGGQLILFGGTSNTSVTTAYGDTWAWGGTGWTQVATTGPSARFGVAMATLGNSIVLFGGDGTNSGANALADTWFWSGGVWTQSTASGPPARVGASAAVLNGKMVVFGGMGTASTYLADTWTFDGTTWTQATSPTSPTARFYASMATLGGQVILFGGYSTAGDMADTWAWNGSTWTQLAPAASPTARSGAAATTYNGTMVVFGGDVAGTYQADTWIYNGATWTASTATGPQARFGGMMGAL